MSFETYTKLWPHQLDLLSGPLLEDDDDDVNVTSLSLQNEVLSESSINENLSDDFGPISVNGIMTEKSNISLENNMGDLFDEKKHFHSLNEGGLGMLVYIGSKGKSTKESDEEVDVETVDDDTEITLIGNRWSSHNHVNQANRTDVFQVKSEDSLRSSGLQSEEQNAAISHSNIYSSCGDQNAADGTTVLQANDVDSLLEQFEASEGITSQESKSLLSPKILSPSCSVEYTSFSQSAQHESSRSLETNDIQGQNPEISQKNWKSSSYTPEIKDISPHIIQKIKMASSTKKGSILIVPPAQKRKSRSKCSQPNGPSEIKRSNRSSVPASVASSGLKSSSIVTSTLPYFLRDHDYCVSSVPDPSLKLENVKSCKISGFSNTVETNRSSLTTRVIKAKRAVMEKIFVPDAQIEVEVIDSMSSIDCLSDSFNDCLVSEQNKPVQIVSNPQHNGNKNNSVRNSELSEVSSPAKLSFSRILCKSPSKQCSENKHSTFLHSTQANHRTIHQDVPHSRSSNINAPSNRSPVWGKRLFEDFSHSRSPSHSPNKKPCSHPGSRSDSPSWSPKNNFQFEEDSWMSPRAAFVDNNGRNFWRNEKQIQIPVNTDTVKTKPGCPRKLENIPTVKEERRVVYVGKIVEGTTVSDLRDCFLTFGPIQDISVHFRDNGDNYGFVTFFDRNDAYEVVERGNCDPKLRRFDLSFGGRRQFCKTRYSDLDFSNEDAMSWSSEKNDFDTLLQKAKAKCQIVRRQSVVSQ